MEQVQEAETGNGNSGNDMDTDYAHNYAAPWDIYSIAFSSKQAAPFRLGIGSLKDEEANHVEVIQMNPEVHRLEKKFEFEHKYPPTKLMWVPDTKEQYADLLATSSDVLRIWEIEDNRRSVLKCELANSKKELTGPLTSFDWNAVEPHTIITSSIDTTCSLWDIQKQALIKTLIAHDKEVFDVSFSPDPHAFATVGADGSVRNFDTR